MATATSSWREPRQGSQAGRSFIDRALAALLLLGVAAAAALVFLVGIGVLDPQPLMLDEPLRAVAAVDGPARALVIAGSLAAGIVAAGLLVRRLAPDSASYAGGTHVIDSDDHGIVVVETDGVEHVAEAAATRATGVVEAQVRVRGRGADPLAIRVVAGVLGGTDIKKAGEETRRQVQRAVEQVCGLEVRAVSVKLRVLPSDAFERGLL